MYFIQVSISELLAKFIDVEMEKYVGETFKLGTPNCLNRAIYIYIYIPSVSKAIWVKTPKIG